MIVDLHYQVDDKSVETLFADLYAVLAPPAIGAFLGSTIDPYLRQRAQERFQSEGDDVVGAWLPLTSATQKIRASQGYGSAHPINHRTGKLEAYITESPNQISVHSLGATLTLPGNRPTGEMKRKVETAQVGKVYPNTPARPVLGMNERDLAFTMSALELYIRRGGMP